MKCVYTTLCERRNEKTLLLFEKIKYSSHFSRLLPNKKEEDRRNEMKRKQIKSYLTLGQQKYLRDAHKTPRKLKHLHLSPPHLFFTGAQLPWIHIPLVFVVVVFFLI